MTLSRNRTASPMAVANLLVDDEGWAAGRTNLDTLIEPRVQDSYARSVCSPRDLVASMSPKRGVGLSALIWSRKITPALP